MALSYRKRKLLAVLIVMIGMPLYVVAAVNLVDWADARWGRQPIWAEFLIYVGLGILWILPFKSVFKGIGQADPEAPPGPDDRSH